MAEDARMFPFRTTTYIEISFYIFVLGSLYITGLYNYLLFHSLVELFSIIISFAVFILAWNSRRLMDNNYLLFLGIAYFFVGLLDLIHTLTYKGIEIVQGYGTNLPTQLWISSRYLQSLSAVIAVFFIRRRFSSYFVFASYLAVVSLLLFSIFYWKFFPDCYIEGMGLTPFKKVSEYIISSLLLLATVMLLKERSEFDRHILMFLVSANIIAIASELAFTLYAGVYDIANMAGHFFKLTSFYLLYRAIVVTGIMKPFDLLLRNLKKNEESLQKANDELQLLNTNITDMNEQMETLVAERTMGLMALTVADKIRNPAFVIGCHCKRILEKENIPEYMREPLKDITEESVKLEGIVKDFETLLKNKKSVFRYEKINEIIKEVEPFIKKEALNKGVFLSVNPGDDSLRINSQKNLLCVAIMHLLKNAVEATPDGGSVTISASREGDSAIIIISDTGIGIPGEYIDKIFDPFFSTKRLRFGMGLPLVKQIVLEHLGDIDVKSDSGKGTVFRITLPTRWAEPGGSVPAYDI